MSKQLPAPGETRWNGQYRLLEAIESSFEEVKFIAGGFLDSDLLPLRELINFLEPFYLLTKTLEAEQQATIHHVLPAFCNLERHIAAQTFQKHSSKGLLLPLTCGLGL